MSIVLQGSTSGSITLQEPAVAGSTVLSLPATSGTLITTASTVTPSLITFSASNNSNQSISNNTPTKIIFQTESFDTANCFDNTTNYRFTPNVAGYYQLNACIKLENPGTTGTLVCSIIRNGTTYVAEGQIPTASGYNLSANTSTIVYANGSSDYFEVYVTQVTGATRTVIANGILATFFNGSLLRSA